MVTMPSEAAQNYDLVHALLKDGVDCMRINCAHDNHVMWSAMVRHLKRARRALKVDCCVLMDLAGPKIRTGAIRPSPAVLKIRPRRDEYGRMTRAAHVWITNCQKPHLPADAADAVLKVDRLWLASLCKGEELRLLDTRNRHRRFTVTDTEHGGAWAALTHTAYITNGSSLSRRGRNKHGGTTTTVVRGIEPTKGSIRLSAGDSLILTVSEIMGAPSRVSASGEILSPARVHCTYPRVPSQVRAGERVLLMMA
jgi:pyruvate kinase